jgi:hypothetical protein
VTIFGLIFVASDLSNPTAAAFDKVDKETAVNVFSPFSKIIKDLDPKSSETAEMNINHFINTVVPFMVYMLACGGFIFLIQENISLWKTMVQLKPVNRFIWTTWIVVLGILSLLPIYLGTSLIFEGLWYIFIIIAVLCLFYWAYWASIQKQ